jgi:hypothetical protein
VGWINEKYIPLHGVPLNYAFVRQVAEHNYRDAFSIGALSFDIASEGPAYDPMAHKGGLKLAGPPEALHALWFAADRDLADADVTDKTVKQWVNVFKSVACVFYYLPDDLSAHYHQETARTRDYNGLRRDPSGLQKVMKVIKIKEKSESLKGQKLTADQVHDEIQGQSPIQPHVRGVHQGLREERNRRI